MSRRNPWNTKYQYQCEYKSYPNNDYQGESGDYAPAQQQNRGQNSYSRGALCQETKYQVTVTKREFYTGPGDAKCLDGAGGSASHYPAVQQNGAAKSVSRAAARRERAYERRAQATVDAIDRELAKDPAYHKWISQERGEELQDWRYL
ncbi:uncharacterized protein [Drosophila pseudoobscura]|uniref:Uncharacterized protein n=1 Tax=Drosophila pseudoobscura pseudoobscura TaxID=46245 RepID=A0A6I8V4W5_DROPS|nr:uncharacterized protein LOC6898996 [Drosophila pseudoobscura]